MENNYTLRIIDAASVTLMLACFVSLSDARAAFRFHAEHTRAGLTLELWDNEAETIIDTTKF